MKGGKGRREGGGREWRKEEGREGGEEGRREEE